MTRRRGVPAAAATVLAVVVGCGPAAPPGEAVPALRTQLSRVDTALGKRAYADARRALDALTRATIAARDAGRLTTEQATRVLTTVARLTADLPALPATPQPRTPRPIATASEPPRPTASTPVRRPTASGEPSREDGAQSEVDSGGDEQPGKVKEKKEKKKDHKEKREK